MADKELSILIKTTDTVSDVLKKIGAQAEQTAGKMAAAGKGKPSFFAEIGKQAETGTLSMGSFTAAATRALGPVAMVGGAVLAVGGAVVAAGVAITALTIKIANQGDMFDELAQKTGVSVETLSGLQLVAAKSSMSIETMGSAINKMQKAMVAAAEAGDKDKLFAALDIPVEVNGRLRDTNDVLMDLADKFQSMPDGAQKSALALKVFGRAGADMIPIMNMGRVAIEEQIAKAKELGIVWSTEDAKAAADLTDSIDELKFAFTGLKKEAVTPLIGPLTDVVNITTMLVTHWKELGVAFAGVIGPMARAEIAMSAMGIIIPIISEKMAGMIKLLRILKILSQAGGSAGPAPVGSGSLESDTAMAFALGGKPTTPARTGTGGRAAGKTPAQIAAEEAAKEQAAWDKEHRADVDAQGYAIPDYEAGLRESRRADAEAELADIDKAKAAQVAAETEKNNAILARQAEFQQMYLNAATATFQGGTDIMADCLARMIQGQKVSAKGMMKAAGQMFGGVLSQMGTSLIATGVADMVKAEALSANPLTPGWGALLWAAGGKEIVEGTALKTLGALMGGSGSGAGAGRASGGGHGGHEVPNRGAAATSIGSASVTFEGIERLRGRFVMGDYADIVGKFLDEMNQAKRRDVHMEFAA